MKRTVIVFTTLSILTLLSIGCCAAWRIKATEQARENTSLSAETTTSITILQTEKQTSTEKTTMTEETTTTTQEMSTTEGTSTSTTMQETTTILETTSITKSTTTADEETSFSIVDPQTAKDIMNNNIKEKERKRGCKIGVSVVEKATEKQLYGYNEEEQFSSNCTIKFLITWCYHETDGNWNRELVYNPQRAGYQTYNNCNLRTGTYTAQQLAVRSILYSDNRAYECLLRHIGYENFKAWYIKIFNTENGTPAGYGFMGYCTPLIRAIAWSEFANTTYADLNQELKDSFVNADPSDAGLGMHKGGWYSGSKNRGATISECGITKDGKYAVSIFIQYKGSWFVRADVTEISNWINQYVLSCIETTE